MPAAPFVHHGSRQRSSGRADGPRAPPRVKHLAPGGDDDAAAENVVFSPVSVHAALSLVAAGARGVTLAQLLAFLGAPSAEELAEFGSLVSHSVLVDRISSDGPRVLFGGGIWVDDSRGELTDAFCQVAVKSYKSKARTVSFSKEPEKAVKMINEWVKKATDNLIDTIITRDDITALTDLVLANAVYFKGEWQDPFRSSCTYQSTFHRLDGSLVTADFMSARGTRHVACMDGFKVLKLPYMPGEDEMEAGRRKRRRSGGASVDSSPEDNTQYSMFIFLPDNNNQEDGMKNMVDVVTAAPSSLYNILAETKERYVKLILPKFKIAFSWGHLGDALNQLGLTLPFSPETADLSGVCEEEERVDDNDGSGSRRPVFVGQLAHQAVVEVNELGTEAAAVTSCVLYGCCRPPPDRVEFVADHPFSFFIVEERSGVIVFAGHVLDPTN
ncbi:hypothetical protein PR202_ga22098 [Eleusine coracana subsp. coracana]|uniref:Serpin domain-containing protein n=1 Tax=Eleusine coracana subsp. coracana TaxID=191504 RepID=A0AAV5D3C2_ELECO|nr:hypothetical protein PR202_ga22098 [Eleusine coracana subsp. coracana]